MPDNEVARAARSCQISKVALTTIRRFPFFVLTLLNASHGRRRPVRLRCALLGFWTALLASCSKTPEQPSKIDIEVSRYAVALPPVSQTTLTATVIGTDLNAPIHWTTSAPGIATVADDGPFGVITGVAEGTATIYAALQSNPKVRSAPVTVTIQRVPAMVSFSVDTALQQLIVGDSKTFALNPVLAEPRATVSYAFSSGNVAVASVNPTTGVISANSAGVATITATATATGAGLLNATLSATVQVHVATISAHERTNLTAGRLSTCALKESGQAFCWGWNVRGQLGDGTTTDRNAPTAVLGGLSFVEVSQGYWHTCALAADNKAYCWGHGANGRLGTGDTTQRLAPAPVVGSMSFSSVDAGGTHTCAINTASNLFCWGSNLNYQLGDGSQQDRWSPTAVKAPGMTFSSVALSLEGSCALGSNGAMSCLGRTGAVLEPSGTSFRQIGLGGVGHCALSPRGQVACWTEDPLQYLPGFVFKSIAQSDAQFVCGITPSSDAYCWGSGASGQLGNGVASNRALPTLVSGGLKFKELSLGEAHTCGLTLTNQVYCWGSNSNGQLGTSGGNSLVPQLVPFSR